MSIGFKAIRAGIMRSVTALSVGFLLSGCLADTGENTGGSTGENTAPLKLAGGKIAMLSAEIVPNRVTAKGPSGFCVDKRSLRSNRRDGFALLAPCAALGGKPTGHEEPVLLTIQAQPKSLQTASLSGAGLAIALAEHGPIHQETGDGLSFVQLLNGGDKFVPNGEPKHWRATLSFNGYLIGLAVYSEKGGAAADKRGKALLLAFAEQVLDASPLETADPAAARANPKSNKLPKLLNNFLQ